MADINHLLHMPVVMMGYGLDTDGLHGTNEHYSIEMFQRGIERRSSTWRSGAIATLMRDPA